MVKPFVLHDCDNVFWPDAQRVMGAGHPDFLRGVEDYTMDPQPVEIAIEVHFLHRDSERDGKPPAEWSGTLRRFDLPRCLSDNFVVLLDDIVEDPEVVYVTEFHLHNVVFDIFQEDLQ